MIKVIKRSFFVMMVLVAMFTLASCNGKAKKAAQAVNRVKAVTFKNTYYNGDAFSFPTVDVAAGAVAGSITE